MSPLVALGIVYLLIALVVIAVAVSFWTAVFLAALVAAVWGISRLGRTKTHGADHDATGTRNLWPGG